MDAKAVEVESNAEDEVLIIETDEVLSVVNLDVRVLVVLMGLVGLVGLIGCTGRGFCFFFVQTEKNNLIVGSNLCFGL